jgi:hypothetical protein
MVVQYTTAYYDRDNIPRLVYCYFPEPSETVLETQMISQPLEGCSEILPYQKKPKMENFLEPTNSLNSKKIQSSDFICSTSG